MSIALYDKALVEKLNRWSKDTNLTITGPSETKRLFQVVTDTTNDSPIKLPLISLTRKGGFEILSTEKRPLTFDGLDLEANKNKSMQLNAIPIRIEYQLDVYTRYLEEADQYIRNLVFNIINYPKLQVILPYMSKNYVHDANIRLTSEISDNSDIPERLISGQFTRWSIPLFIDDAYLWDIRVRDNYKIDIENMGIDYEIDIDKEKSF